MGSDHGLIGKSYQPGDEEAIIGLANVVYPHVHLNRRGWNWRYRDNPAGHALIELAWDGDVLVGHYAVCPVLMRAGDREALAYLSLLTMVHPDYRGRGLFQELAKRTYNRAGRMVWGFPNRVSHRGFARDLGWADIHEIPVLRLHLEDQPHPQANRNVIEVGEFDGRFNDLWQRKRSGYRFMVKRDCSFLQWRYVHNPTEHYRILAYAAEGQREILGYLVFKWYKGEYQIVDLLAQSVQVGLELIKSLVVLSFQDAVSPMNIGLWLNVGDPLHHALEKMGFRNGSPVTYFGGKILPPWWRLPEYREWYITMGDNDVF